MVYGCEKFGRWFGSFARITLRREDASRKYPSGGNTKEAHDAQCSRVSDVNEPSDDVK
jgi:hypothetical protein